MTNTGLRLGPQEQVRTLAAGLLQIGAVELRPQEPFTWSSGWKSPIYCDNRMVLSSPLLRKLVITSMATLITENFPGLDGISGAATGGIAPAALVAGELGLSLSYVRGSNKDHGKGKLVEGRVRDGDRIVLIEDTLSTGGSAYKAVQALQAEGAAVEAVIALFSYDFEQVVSWANTTQVPAYRLLTYETLVDVARELGYVSDDQVELLLRWRLNPSAYDTAQA